jgi:DNA-binding NarL/FixJ family response regulator
MTRILIADPDPASRKALALLFSRKLGAEMIFEATEADSLLNMVTSTLPNVLLLDDSLNGLDLPETCQRLQKVFPTLTIALLSLNESAGEKAAALGIKFIHKGACLDETLSHLKTILGETK